MTTLVIDADGLVYTASAAAQKNIRWDDDVYTSHADINQAQDLLRISVERAVEEAEADDLILCWSSPPYFRKAVLPTYKSNRKGSIPPLVMRDLYAWAKETWPGKAKPGLEADDVCGILGTHPTLVKSPVIYSQDKDLQQIPGLHFKPGEGIYRISTAYAERFLWAQVLTGDQKDGYTGIPGCGPKKADAILAKAKLCDGLDFHAVVRAAYHKAGLTDDDLATQYNVARILRAENYNFKTGEPILWQMPPT